MGTPQSFRRNGISSLAHGPLASHIAAYEQHLTERGYAPRTVSSYVGGIAHFAQWVHGRGLRIRQVDEGAMTEFLEEHLACCRCTDPVRHDPRDLRAALRHLLVVLRAQSVIGLPTASTTPVDEELRRFDEHMDHVRGLAPKTRSMALRVVRRMLSARFGDGAVDIATIKPEHVRRFFAQQAKLYSKPASAGTVVSVLRGYFRYRASLGDAVHSLIGAVSYPANWQLASLPKALSAEEVDRLARSAKSAARCGGPTPSYAARSIWGCAVVRSPGSVCKTSTGAPARSRWAAPRAAANTYCRCRRQPARPSPLT